MAHTSLIYVKVKKAGFHSNSPSWSHLQIQFCKVTIFCTGTCKTPCFLCFHSCSRLRCQKLSQSGEAVRVLKLPVGLLEQKVLTGVGVKAGLLSVYLFCSRPSQTSANILRCCKVLTRSEKQAVIQLVWRLCKQKKKEWSVLQQTIISARAHRLEYWKKYLCKTLPSSILEFPTKTNFKLIAQRVLTGGCGVRYLIDLQTHVHVLSVDWMKNVLIHMHTCCDE